MKQVLCLLIVAVVGMCSLGCGRAVGEAAEFALGPKGIYVPLVLPPSGEGPWPLAGYTRFELGSFTDDFGGRTPAELFRLLPAKFQEELAKAKLPNQPGGKTLVIRGSVYHYESSNIVGMALGPLEQVIARVELIDRDSGEVIAQANCVGRTTKAVGKGVSKKTEGLAKAIVSWIKAYYPPPPE